MRLVLAARFASRLELENRWDVAASSCLFGDWFLSYLQWPESSGIMIRLSMHVQEVDIRDPKQSRDALRRAAESLRAGHLIAFPTETVYGVAALADQSAAVERLRRVKATADNAPFTVHLAHPEDAESYCDATPRFMHVARKLWPGPVVLRVWVSEDLIAEKLARLGLPAEARDRLYGPSGLVSLRCPDHALSRELLSSLKTPVIATSANLPGHEPAASAAGVRSQMGEAIDFILDAGRTRFCKPSTIVRVNTNARGIQSLKVERRGVWDERVIRKLTRWMLLLICSGNTCRSPMAEGMAKQQLAEARGIAVDELELAGLEVASAGIFAGEGMPASDQAVAVMRSQGIDISNHRSRTLTREMVREADLILCMTESHRRAVLELLPDAGEKTFRLDPAGDVEDPIGSDVASYQRTAQVIRERLGQRLKEQQI